MFVTSKPLSTCALIVNHLDIFLAVMFWVVWGPATSGNLVTRWAFLIYPLFLLPPLVQMFALPKLFRFIRQQFRAAHYGMELELHPRVIPLWGVGTMIFVYVGIFVSALHAIYVLIYAFAILINLYCLIYLLGSGIHWKKESQQQPVGEFEVFEGAAGAAEMFERMARDAGMPSGFGMFGTGAGFRADFSSSARTAGSSDPTVVPIGFAVEFDVMSGEMRAGTINADGTVTDMETARDGEQVIEVENFAVVDHPPEGGASELEEHKDS